MTELVFIFILVICVSLYYVESAAKMGQYAWLAYTIRPIIFFSGLGLIFFLGTDLESPIWEFIVGLFCIIVGIVLGIRRVLRKKEIQEKLKSGEIKPSGEA